jgi:hypothetical protein
MRISFCLNGHRPPSAARMRGFCSADSVGTGGVLEGLRPASRASDISNVMHPQCGHPP